MVVDLSAHRNGVEPSLGQLLQDLTRQLQTLVRQELRRASVEMSEKVSGIDRQLGMLLAGGAIAYAGLLAIVAGVILLAAAVIPMWLSALLVGLVVVGIGYVMVKQGLDGLKKRDLKPTATIRSLQNDVEMVRREVA